VAKTRAQVEKQKRATEKRKKTEKAILKMAAEMPDVDLQPPSTTPSTGTKATQERP
jgi:hypothetical protein